MANYFIAQTASGAGDGSSPEDAIDLASVAWGARISDTNYFLDVITTATISSSGASASAKMVIRGDWPGRECTITNAGGNGLNISGNNHKYIGITADGCSTNGIRFANGAARSGYEFENVVSKNNGQKGISWIQTLTLGLSDVTFTDCNFDDNTQTGIFLNTTSINVASAISDMTFTRVTSLRNGVNAAKLGNSGIDTKNHSGLIIEDCNWSDATGPNGGTAIDGFTSTKHWDNYVTRSVFNGNYGLNGGLNLLDCDYFHVFDNEANNNKSFTDATETTVTIDGNGILIDNGCTNIECYRNICSGNVGNTTHDNSGAGIMVLGATQTRIYGNYGTGNRGGLYLGGATHTDTLMSSNRFEGCLEFGFYLGNVVADNVVIIKANVFTADAVGTGFYRETGVDQTNEDYNFFYNFNADAAAHTLGTNSKTTDPTVLINGVVQVDANTIESGVKWWTGANPQGSDGEPFSDFDTDSGHIQTTFSPFHTKNL